MPHYPKGAMPKYAKADGNQPLIVSALRRVGAQVQHLHSIGQGCPDIVVAFHGSWYMAEIKDPNQPAHRHKLTPAEEAWHKQFGEQAQVYILFTVEDAMRMIGVRI